MFERAMWRFARSGVRVRVKIIQSSIGPLQNIDHCINYVQ